MVDSENISNRRDELWDKKWDKSRDEDWQGFRRIRNDDGNFNVEYTSGGGEKG